MYPHCQNFERVLSNSDFDQLTMIQMKRVLAIMDNVKLCEAIESGEMISPIYWCIHCKEQWEKAYRLFDRFLELNKKAVAAMPPAVAEQLKKGRARRKGRRPDDGPEPAFSD